MDKATIIHSVGEEQYQAASSELRQIANRPDYGSNKASSGSDLPHKVSDCIWDADLSVLDALALFFDVYDDLPCYGTLMYAKHHYEDWSERERSVWWSEFRMRLQRPNANPLLYSLWCDWFEDPKTVTEAWSTLTDDADESLLQLLFPMSGPVPWELKAPVFEQCANSPRLKDAIFRGLLGSAFDYFGNIDRSAAKRLLERLQVETEGYRDLKERVAG